MRNELQLLSDSIEDLKWFQENSNKITEKYSGKFIAIKNKSIISASLNVNILIDNLEKTGIDSNLVLIKYINRKGEIIIF